jgi:hypothetical protein
VSTITPVETNVGAGKLGQLNLEIQPERGAPESGDGGMFRAALERHMSAMSGPAPAGSVGKPSLAEKVTGRVSAMAGDIQKDQQYVSRLLENATRTGDSMQLMKAMMAMNDYHLRVQTITKTVSKSTQAFEQLTKLQ